jgi:hypothetical protein
MNKKVIISEKQLVSLIKKTINEEKNSLRELIQPLIDDSLETIRKASEEFGLGEMDELDEIESVDKIVIDRIVKSDKIKVYINIYKTTKRLDFDNIRAEIQYHLDDWIPNIELYINEIIDTRTYGPGIDW